MLLQATIQRSILSQQGNGAIVAYMELFDWMINMQLDP